MSKMRLWVEMHNTDMARYGFSGVLCSSGVCRLWGMEGLCCWWSLVWHRLGVLKVLVALAWVQG